MLKDKGGVSIYHPENSLENLYFLLQHTVCHLVTSFDEKYLSICEGLQQFYVSAQCRKKAEIIKV